jgi:hypothetical protein
MSYEWAAAQLDEEMKQVKGRHCTLHQESGGPRVTQRRKAAADAAAATAAVPAAAPEGAAEA